MDLLIDVEVDTPLGRQPSSNLENDEYTEKQSKILSSRCTRSKKNLFIMSNQSTKMFPPDFFVKSNSQEAIPKTEAKTERSSSVNLVSRPIEQQDILTTIEVRGNKKIQDQDLDDERELLDLLNQNCKTNTETETVKRKRPIKVTIDDTKIESTPTLSAGKPKNIYDLKLTGFEMIPEEDEEKNKTEYETAKKFFDPNRSKVKDEEFMKAGTNNTISNNISRLRNLNGMNREKSQDSLSTFELTNEMDKSKVRCNLNIVNSETNIKYAHDIFDFSKLNVIKETNNKDIFKETANFNSKLEPILNNQTNGNLLFDRQSPKYHHKVESAFTFHSNTNEQPEISKTQTAKRSQSNRTRKESFPQDSVRNTTKAQTPPDRKYGNKLPAINSQRRKLSSQESNSTFSDTNSNLDIKNIFAVADGYKEDPIIKQKLDDIMQNIVDIRNVIDQKFKKRLKIASAPTNCEDAEFKALITNRNDINSADTASNKINMFDGKFKSNFIKIESANSKLKSSRKISGEISGFMANLSTANNISTKENKMLKIKSKDVMPIKLMKK